MRRNVRRLNREVGNLSGSMGDRDIQESNEDSDHQQEKEGGGGGDVTMSSSKKVPKSRKAANLAELQRYFRAAAEAAQEVLAEQGDMALDSRVDVKKLAGEGAEEGQLDSPGRMVALSLANGNPLFRYIDYCSYVYLFHD
jgi:hypothetical protein